MRDACGHLAARLAVVAQAQHVERVGQPGKAQADAALGVGFAVLLGQGPPAQVQHVVEHAHQHAGAFVHGPEVQLGLRCEGFTHEARQHHRAEHAGAVGGQGLFATGVGRGDLLQMAQVVLAVHGVGEEHTRLGRVVGGVQQRVPQHARGQGAVDPLTVVAPVGALVHLGLPGAGAVHQ